MYNDLHPTFTGEMPFVHKLDLQHQLLDCYNAYNNISTIRRNKIMSAACFFMSVTAQEDHLTPLLLTNIPLPFSLVNK